PRCLHHFVSHPAKEEGIGLLEVLDRVTMQVFVREHCTMIAAPVQCDVDGIPKASHYVLLMRANAQDNVRHEAPSGSSCCQAALRECTKAQQNRLTARKG